LHALQTQANEIRYVARGIGDDYDGPIKFCARAAQDCLGLTGRRIAFWMELSAIGLLLKFVDEGLLDRARFGRIHFHTIEAHAELEKIALSTKRNNHLPFLEYLFDLGRQTADAWLADKGPAIGQRSTIDLQKLLPVGA
jgi:hypothetical protein